MLQVAKYLSFNQASPFLDDFVITMPSVIVLWDVLVGMMTLSWFYSTGDLLKLLDISSSDNVLLTTYGKLQPPFGKHRLKVSFVYFLCSINISLISY